MISRVHKIRLDRYGCSPTAHGRYAQRKRIVSAKHCFCQCGVILSMSAIPLNIRKFPSAASSLNKDELTALIVSPLKYDCLSFCHIKRQHSYHFSSDSIEPRFGHDGTIENEKRTSFPGWHLWSFAVTTACCQVYQRYEPGS